MKSPSTLVRRKADDTSTLPGWITGDLYRIPGWSGAPSKRNGADAPNPAVSYVLHDRTSNGSSMHRETVFFNPRRGMRPVSAIHVPPSTG